MRKTCALCVQKLRKACSLNILVVHMAVLEQATLRTNSPVMPSLFASMPGFLPQAFRELFPLLSTTFYPLSTGLTKITTTYI